MTIMVHHYSDFAPTLRISHLRQMRFEKPQTHRTHMAFLLHLTHILFRHIRVWPEIEYLHIQGSTSFYHVSSIFCIALAMTTLGPIEKSSGSETRKTHHLGGESPWCAVVNPVVTHGAEAQSSTKHWAGSRHMCSFYPLVYWNVCCIYRDIKQPVWIRTSHGFPRKWCTSGGFPMLDLSRN